MIRSFISRGMLFCLMLLVASSSSVWADGGGVRNISGEYTFYGDDHHSPQQCKEAALQGAIAEALAREFGTVVSQSIMQQETLTGGSESTFFDALNVSEVKGEWIANTREPEYEFLPPGPDGSLIVRCKVWGKACPVSNRAVEFDSKVLRNGTDERHADTHFRSGDDMMLSFRSPVDGYVVVYLLGADRRVYRLLPYMDFNEGAVSVKHDRNYTFFHAPSGDRTHGTVDEMTLYTDMPVERNRIYVVFSPNRFDRPVDQFTSEGVPRSLSYEDFSKWLQKARLNDDRMNVRLTNIDITEK